MRQGMTANQPRQGQPRRDLPPQLAPLRSRRGDRHLRPGIEAGPAVVERVDRRPRLEVQVARRVDPLEHVHHEAGDVVDVESGVVLRAQIHRYLARLSWFLPKMWLAMVRISCGRVRPGTACSARCRWRRAAGGRPPRPRRARRGRRGSPAGWPSPVSSWMSAPKLVSSCGGRPTTVNGQIASGRCRRVHSHHREIMDQAVVAEVVAERTFGLRLLGSTVPVMTKSASRSRQHAVVVAEPAERRGCPGRRRTTIPASLPAAA
jgi:hypothetical protein